MLFCKGWGDGVSSRLAVPKESIQEPLTIRLDISKSKTVLLWHPTWSTEFGMRKLIEWEKIVNRGEKAEFITKKQIKEYYNS